MPVAAPTDVRPDRPPDMRPDGPPDVLVLAAVEEEMAPLRAHLSEAGSDARSGAGSWVRSGTGSEAGSGARSAALPAPGRRGGPPRAAAGRLCGTPARLLVAGPGMINTALALTAAIERRPPALILQIGCAGALPGAGLDIGDIGIATMEIDAHLGLERPAPGGLPTGELPTGGLPTGGLPSDELPTGGLPTGGLPRDSLPMAGLPMAGLPMDLPFPVLIHQGMEVRHRYPVSLEWVGLALEAVTPAAPAGARVMAGPFVTVATITTTDARASALYRAFGACMENMEGAAAAHVALIYGLPFLEIRCASNRAGRRTRREWRLDAAFDACGAAAISLFSALNPTLLRRMAEHRMETSSRHSIKAYS